MTTFSTFGKGILLGLILGALITVFSYPYVDNIKANLLNFDKKIYSLGEHIQSANEIEEVLAGMKQAGIKQIVLVSSPKELIYYDGLAGFTDYDLNNNELLQIARDYSPTFKVFCTINPADNDKLAKLQNCLKNGAAGLKLYSGQNEFYQPDYPLDSPVMTEIYQYLSDNNLPLIFHVNLNYYQEEFETVLSSFPKIPVICPYWCLSSSNLDRLEALLQNYPNFNISLAFGYQDYLKEGLSRISDNLNLYRNFINKYADRIFYSTGAVFTNYENKDDKWISNSFKTYQDLLEKPQFKLLNDASSPVYNGLQLDKSVLDKIYRDNWRQLFAK